MFEIKCQLLAQPVVFIWGKQHLSYYLVMTEKQITSNNSAYTNSSKDIILQHNNTVSNLHPSPDIPYYFLSLSLLGMHYNVRKGRKCGNKSDG